MVRKWELGKDVHEKDNLLDGFTFECLITAVICNCEVINEASIKKTLEEILESRMEDMYELLKTNMPEIKRRAKQGRD